MSQNERCFDTFRTMLRCVTRWPRSSQNDCPTSRHLNARPSFVTTWLACTKFARKIAGSCARWLPRPLVGTSWFTSAQRVLTQYSSSSPLRRGRIRPRSDGKRLRPFDISRLALRGNSTDTRQTSPSMTRSRPRVPPWQEFFAISASTECNEQRVLTTRADNF